jgi:coenzyme A diphosphatase NUDT7
MTDNVTDVWRFSHETVNVPQESNAAHLRRLLFEHTLFTQQLPHDNNPKRAGILVPLFFEDGEWKFLYTVRASTMRTHPGDVAFPGGKRDVTDVDDIAAAVREAEEEIGLASMEVIGVLEPMRSKAGLTCTPVVALIDYQSFFPVPNVNEVDEIFSVPVSFLIDASKLRKHSLTGSSFLWYEWLFARESDGKTFRIYGLTAAITLYVLYIAFQKSIAGVDFSIYTTRVRKGTGATSRL